MTIERRASHPGHSLRAWYASSIGDFLVEPVESIYGTIAANSTFSVETTQREAWLGEIGLLRAVLGGIDASMVIFVPPGERRDATRPPEFYDGTYAFLRESGVAELR